MHDILPNVRPARDGTSFRASKKLASAHVGQFMEAQRDLDILLNGRGFLRPLAWGWTRGAKP